MKVTHSSLLSGLTLLILIAAAVKGIVLYHNECPRAGLYGDDEIIMLWDPKNCSKFYKCSFTGTGRETKPFEFSCPKGLTFDPELGVCGWWVNSNPKPCHPIYYRINKTIVY